MAKPITIRENSGKSLDPLDGRTCGKCGSQARFVGLEADPRQPRADLCTYECNTCGHLQTEVIPNTGTPTNGASHLHS